jgi:S1-C subfamily serine protease
MAGAIAEDTPPPPEPAEPLPLASPRDPAQRRTPVVEAVARSAPAVVSITTEVPNQSPFRNFYNLPNATSEGSGVVIDSEGVLLTNAHVIDGAVTIKATFMAGALGTEEQSFNAQVLGLDKDLDLAVLKLEGAVGLPTVPLGTSSDLLLGEPVIAIGNPFGLGITVTTGVISSACRTLQVAERAYQDYIQTDAGINPGNSGGALLNIHGQLIGINTAIRRDAENIGFAIPIDRAAKVARDLMRYGSVRAPWLGISVEDVGGPRYSGTAIAQGAILVRKVDPAGGARLAGIKPEDILLKVDGKPIHSRGDLNLKLATRKPGDTLEIEGLRGGAPFTAKIQANPLPEGSEVQMLAETLGVELTALTPQLARAHRVRGNAGLLVTTVKPQGSFARAGLRVGDLVLAIHGVSLKSPDEFGAALLRARASHRASVLLRVQRGPYLGNVEVEI